MDTISTDTVTTEIETNVVIPTAIMFGHVLRDLLVGCLIATGKDNTLPTLTGINISWDQNDTHVTGAATDRYRLIIGTSLSDTNGKACFLLPKPAIVELIKALPKVPKRINESNPKVTITVISHQYVSFNIVDTDRVMTPEYKLLDGEFPEFKKLIPEDSAFESSTGVKEMAWNPTFMASFDKVPRERNIPIKWKFLDSNKPIIGTFDNDFVDWTLLLMPVRLKG